MLDLGGAGVGDCARDDLGPLGIQRLGAGPVRRGGIAPPVAAADQDERGDQGGQETGDHCESPAGVWGVFNDRPCVV